MKFEQSPIVQNNKEYKKQPEGIVDDITNGILKQYNFPKKLNESFDDVIRPIKQNVLFQKLEMQSYMEDVRDE